jgi:hypothetical protein
MSSLMIALVAGMTVGSSPERISSQAEERLCIDGYWEGTWQILSRRNEVRTFQLRLEPGSIWSIPPGGRVPPSKEDCEWIDLGNGKCQLTDEKSTLVGIYKREADRLLICLRGKGDGIPAAFQVRDGQILIILKRVKPPR